MVADRFETGGPIASALAAIAGVEQPNEETFLLRDDQTVIATAHLAGWALKVETNSLRRADAACEIVEKACGDRLRFVAREIVDPLSEPVREAAAACDALPPPLPEEMADVRELKHRYYAGWIEEPIPALGGKTPRQAMKTARGRERVDALVRHIEHSEARLHREERFDVGELRRALGLE